MEFNISDSTSTPLITVSMVKGEKIKLETGSMVYKNSAVELEGKTNGGVFSAIGKSVLGGENFFTTQAHATGDDPILALAPRAIGAVKKIDTSNGQWFLTDGSFLASTENLTYKIKRQKGLGNALFGGTGGLFILKTEGTGEMLIASFGDMIEIELDGTRELQIDNGHVVCWEESLSYNITRASGIFGFKTGEGLLNNFSGKGRVIIQTRQLGAFAESLIPFMPTQKTIN